jgi:diketogulonate reductase-like aldo/keto reductase
MGDTRQKRADEILALRTAVDLGMSVVDTAEMYGNGAAEELIAEALGDRRDEIFLISKVLPQHATKRGTVSACEASLRRLKTDRLDLYLLHWRGSVALQETLDGFELLMRDGKIRQWGVSNFDVDDMEELVSLQKPARSSVAMNQVLYNLMRRGIEFDLLPWSQARNIQTLAYSPLEQGRLPRSKALRAIAQAVRATPAQVALAWILRQPDVIAIPKAGHVDRVRENHGALDLRLSAAVLAELDAAFKPPSRKIALEMI